MTICFPLSTVLEVAHRRFLPSCGVWSVLPCLDVSIAETILERLELSPRSAPLLGAFLLLGGIACVEPREKSVNAWCPSHEVIYL